MTAGRGDEDVKSSGRPRSGLRRRLILAATYLLGLVVIALEFPLGASIWSQAKTAFESTEITVGALVSSEISDDVFRAGRDPSGVPQPSSNMTGVVQQNTPQEPGSRIIVVDVAGRILVDSGTPALPVGTAYTTPDRFEFAPVLRGGNQITRRYAFSQAAGKRVLLVTVPVLHNGDVVGAVQVAEPVEAFQSKVYRTWIGLGVIGVVVIMVGLLLAWFLATSLARPVRRLEEAAVKVGEGDLEARAPVGGPHEIATLAGEFNRMAEALAANLEAQRDFVANASHQLRTPLTGLRLRLEAIKADGGFAGDQAGKAEAEVDRLAALVNDLLQLARASSTESASVMFALGNVARKAVERWNGPAREAAKEIRLGEQAAVSVSADVADTSHILDNLIENAIRYGPPGTRIEVCLAERDGKALLSVEDDGPGIPPAERARVFDRFYRGSTGKQAGPGTGLGLAIVAELVRKWGGEIRLVPAPGTRFEATFPKALPREAEPKGPAEGEDDAGPGAGQGSNRTLELEKQP